MSPSSKEPATPDRSKSPEPTPLAADAGALARLADFAYRRRWRMLGMWVVALVALGFLSSSLKGDFSADYSTPGSESQAAASLLSKSFGAGAGDTVDVAWEAPAGVKSAAIQKRVKAFLAQAEQVEDVGSAQRVRISRDGKIAATELNLTARQWDVPTDAGKKLIALAKQASGDGLTLSVGGGPIQHAEGGNPVEGPGLIAALLILLIAFGSLIAVGLPFVTTLFGLGLASMLVGLLTAVVAVPDWATAVSSLLGIGVGIDYALLVLTRYRDGLGQGKNERDALIEAVTTAGRSVLLAGTTVVIAVMGLFLVGVPYMRGVALATSITIIVVMTAAVTLLPALLAFAGRKVNSLRIPGFKGATLSAAHVDEGGSTLAARWSRQVQRRPWPMAAGAVAILLALAAPAIHMNLGFPDAGNDPTGKPTQVTYEMLKKGFGPGTNGPLLIAAQLPHGTSAARPQLDALVTQTKATPGVATVSPPRIDRSGRTAMIAVVPTGSPQSGATKALVHTLRDAVVPAATQNSAVTAYVGGTTAAYIDQSDFLSGRLWVFIAGVVGLSLLLLLMAFRSPIIAVKAGVMNLLSVGAAYGVMSVLAKGGTAGQAIGIDHLTPIAPFVPVITFAILFGLSMDYEVFLMSRIREEYLAGKETHEAVTAGLAKTARVITAAAAIMVAVFLAFVLSDDNFLRLMGIGMATAIFVDATLVRMILVPAFLQIMGERNWWIPSWLDRALPQVQLEPKNLAIAGSAAD